MFEVELYLPVVSTDSIHRQIQPKEPQPGNTSGLPHAEVARALAPPKLLSAPSPGEYVAKFSC